MLTKQTGTVDGLNASGDDLSRNPLLYTLPAGSSLVTGQVLVRDLTKLVLASEWSAPGNLFPPAIGGSSGPPATVPNNLAPLNSSPFPIGAPDQAVLPTSANGGDVLGVYQGPSINSLGASSSISVPATLRVNGIGWALAGVSAGGAFGTQAINVGTSLVLASASTDIQNFVTAGSRTIGESVGRATAYPISVKLATAVTATGSQTVTLTPNCFGITTSTPLTIDTGTAQEVVTPSAVSQGNPMVSSITIAGTPGTNTFTLVMNGVTVSVALTSAQTATTAAAAIAAAMNASALTVGPAAILGPVSNVAGVVGFFTNEPTGTQYAYTTSMTGSGGFTTTAGGATLLGTNPTITATFANTHAAGVSVQGVQNTVNTAIIAAPTNGAFIGPIVADINGIL